MGTICSSISSKKCQIILTNALGGTAHYSLSYQKLTSQQIKSNLKFGANIQGNLEGVGAGLNGEVNEQTTKTSKNIKARGHITIGNRATLKLMQHEMALLTLHFSDNQKCGSVVENKQITSSDQAFCLWKPYDQSQPNIFQTWKSDPWRFLPQIAEDLGRNYPIGRVCLSCRQSLGCKLKCQKFKKLKGLSNIQVQNFFLDSNHKPEIIKPNITILSVPHERIEKYQTFSPSQNPSISVSNSKMAEIIKQSIQTNLKQDNMIYNFQVDFNHSHAKNSMAFDFNKNQIIKNNKKVKGWKGAAIVALQPFPEDQWHEIKLWVNAPLGGISFGLVNQKFKQSLGSKQVFQYCPKISYQDNRQGIYLDQQWVLGADHNLGQIMTLAMRVNLSQRKANFVVYNNIKLETDNKDQNQLSIIDIPDFIFGSSNKVYPYVALLNQNDSIMFL